MIRRFTVLAAALALGALAAAPAFAQTTVLDQTPVPIPGAGNTTQASEWLLQSFATGGITCYQSFFRQPGSPAGGPQGGGISAGGLSCPQGANTFSSITGTASPFPIVGQAGAQGGSVTVTGGASSTSANAGGAVQLVGGAPGATGVGGAVSLTGAVGGATSGAGGAASVTGGAGTNNAVGGVASVVGGAGQGTGNGAAANVTGGASGAGATGAGGAVAVAGGAAASTNGAGGAVSMTGGAGVGTGNGGAASLVGGAAGATGTGGAVAVTAGSPTAGNGSNVTVTASAGAGGTNAGGNVNLVPGAAVSTGAPGTIQVNGDAGLICPTFYYTPAGTPTNATATFFIATRPMYVVEASEVHSAANGATLTLGVYHDTGTNAPGAGTDIMSADFNLNATANTVQNTGLSTTVATKTLAAGDRLAVKFSTTITSLANLAVTVCMAPQ